MTRAQQQLSLLALLSSIYTVTFLGLLPIPSKVQDEIIPVLPFWALISFGAYLLFKLGYGVLTFNNVPAAYEELMGEIKQAKTELRKKGVDVD